MNIAWTNGLEPEEAELIVKALEHKGLLLTRLGDIVSNMIKEAKFTPSYENPNWSHKQAHFNGKLEALKTIQRIIGHDE